MTTTIEVGYLISRKMVDTVHDMPVESSVFDDFLDPLEIEESDEEWLELNLKCAELHEPTSADYIQNAENIAQCGVLTDREGISYRFKTPKGSESPPTFSEGEVYDVSELMGVPSKRENSYLLIVRSATTADHLGSSFPSIEVHDINSDEGAESPASGGECPHCGNTLTDDDCYTGPEAPMIGWTYYQCPECEEKSHPKNV